MWNKWSLVWVYCATLAFQSVHGQEAPATKGLRPSDRAGTPAKEESRQVPKFLRYAETSSGAPRALEVAVVRYESNSPDGIQVDLVGAVHIGESRYYSQLNTLFDQYDCVLYELVAPEGTVIPRGGRSEGSSNPVSMLQEAARNVLGLESQLSKVDYTKPHFVRADMTPQQMADKMTERGDTATTVALSALVDILRQQNRAANRASEEPGDQAQSLLTDDLAELTLSDLLNNPLKIKQVLGKQLAQSGSLDQALGETLNQMLVSDRNAVAMQVMQRQLAQGKKRFAIFYGAAHLPDFHQRLVKDYQLHPTNTRWLTAWDLSRTSAPSLDNPTSLLFRLMQALE